MTSETSARQITFVRKLAERTRGKSLNWEDTADENTFQCALGKYTVRIGDVYDNEVGETFSRIELLNEIGRTVESIYPYPLSEAGMSDSQFVFNEIFAGARRIARGSDKALDSALEELNALELEDDIPF